MSHELLFAKLQSIVVITAVAVTAIILSESFDMIHLCNLASHLGPVVTFTWTFFSWSGRQRSANPALF